MAQALHFLDLRSIIPQRVPAVKRRSSRPRYGGADLLSANPEDRSEAGGYGIRTRRRFGMVLVCPGEFATTINALWAEHWWGHAERSLSWATLTN